MVSAALHKTGSYSNEDLILFEKEVSYQIVEQGEVILNAGEVAKSVYYILSGAAYQYRLEDEIEQVIIDLGVVGKWMVDQKSFVAQQPTDTYMKAFEKSQLLVLSIESIHKLIALSPSFFQLGRLLDSASQRTNFFDQASSPFEKYQSILDTSPLILQKFPLKMIASYLKVTPETLSRVRRKIVTAKVSS